MEPQMNADERRLTIICEHLRLDHPPWRPKGKRLFPMRRSKHGDQSLGNLNRVQGGPLA